MEFVSGDSVSQIIATYDKEKTDLPVLTTDRICLLHFPSNSAGRKTLETLKDDVTQEFWWMNTDRILIGKAENIKPEDDEKSGKTGSDSIFTGSTSTLNTSFSIYGSHASMDSPRVSNTRSPRLSIELQAADLGLSSPSRSRASSSSSDEMSPCWKSCVLVLDDDEDHSGAKKPGMSKIMSFNTKLTSDGGMSPQRRNSTRRPSKFLQEHAFENPFSWQAKALISQTKCKEKGVVRKDTLWKQVCSKQKKTKNMIEEDPQYVKKLLGRVVREFKETAVQNVY